VQVSVFLCSWPWHVTTKQHTECIVVFSSAKWLCECSTLLRYQLTVPLLFCLLQILGITVISIRAIPFVCLVEMRCYLEFKYLVSVGVVHADSTFELDRIRYTETEITLPYSINCYQGIDWGTVLLLFNYLCCLCYRIKTLQCTNTLNQTIVEKENNRKCIENISFHGGDNLFIFQSAVLLSIER